eukprot:scaffold87798_cov33-Phaeocystis_antarctica.AAC.1
MHLVRVRVRVRARARAPPPRVASPELGLGLGLGFRLGLGLVHPRRAQHLPRKACVAMVGQKQAQRARRPARQPRPKLGLGSVVR